jgi:hypothetical protein
MKASELFVFMSRRLALDIVEFTHANDREMFSAVLDVIAQARKVRPVFLQRQPRQERFHLMVASLGRPNAEVAAENLIRNWLLKKHAELLSDFLDRLQIKHDKGVVENLPPSVDTQLLHRTIDELLQKYPGETVAVYLWAFNHMNETRWPNLDDLLQEDARLQLDPPTEPASPPAPQASGESES